MEIKNTSEIHTNGVKLLVYGSSGSGKTSLIRTLPNPIVLSAEGGLLSLSGTEIPYIEINTMEGLQEAYRWLTESKEGTAFDSIALDSISEISEVVLSAEKKKTKDPRQAYGSTQDLMGDIIRYFRDIQGKNVYFSAKVEKSQDEFGKVNYAPSMTGNKLGQQLPYFFDEVLAMRVERDAEGNTQRALMCQPDGSWSAKDRSGRLDSWETPDLGEIIKKIGGE